MRSPADAAAFSRFDAANLEQQADADLGTDEDKFHEELWKLLCLNNVPHLVGQRSTEVVQAFFRFLRRQYFVVSVRYFHMCKYLHVGLTAVAKHTRLMTNFNGFPFLTSFTTV